MLLWLSHQRVIGEDVLNDLNGDSLATGQYQPLHVYDFMCNGFSATLSLQEAAKMRQMDGVLDVVCDRKFSLHTTHTPHYPVSLNIMS